MIKTFAKIEGGIVANLAIAEDVSPVLFDKRS